MNNLLTIEDVAEKIHITNFKATQLFKKGFFPVVKIGGTKLVREEDFEKWISSMPVLGGKDLY